MDWVMERDRVQVLDEGWNVIAEVTFPEVERASFLVAPWRASRRAATARAPPAPTP